MEMGEAPVSPDLREGLKLPQLHNNSLLLLAEIPLWLWATRAISVIIHCKGFLVTHRFTVFLFFTVLPHFQDVI